MDPLVGRGMREDERAVPSASARARGPAVRNARALLIDRATQLRNLGPERRMLRRVHQRRGRGAACASTHIMEAACDAYVRGAEVAVPSSVCEAVAEGACTMLDVVKVLGVPLTSEEDAVRARAITLLSRVTGHVAARAPQRLSRQAVRTLSEFFSAKVSDAVIVGDSMAQRMNEAPHVPASAPRASLQAEEDRAMQADGMLVECVRALRVLSGLPAPAGAMASDARTIAAALFGLDLRKYPQPLRFLVYDVVRTLVERHLGALRAMRVPDGADGSAFVRGYAQLVGGEKDPRNLLVLFGVARAFLTAWPLPATEAEAMYNVLFCYFPISFRPPPDDPFGITPDDLKRALRACLAASPAFATMAYPLLLEKLSATGGASKLDVLHTLTACMPVYGAGPTAAHAADLWSYVRLDIVQPTEAAVVPAAQETLTTLIRVLGATHPHVHTILEACIDDVRDAHARRASDAMLVLACLVRAGPDTRARTTQSVLRFLTREASPRPWALLATYLDMLCDTSTPLDREALLALLTSAEAVASVHGMRALVALVRVPHSMHSDDAARAAPVWQDAVLSADDEIRACALEGLEAIRDAHPTLIETRTVPYLLHHLPTHIEAPPLRVRVVLHALARLCATRTLFPLFSRRVWDTLQAMRACEADAAHVGYVCALIVALHVAMEEQVSASDAPVREHAEDVAQRLVAYRRAPIATHAHVAQHASDLLVLVGPHLSPEVASALASDVYAAPPWDAPCAAVMVGLPRAASVPYASAWLHDVLATPPSTLPQHWLLCALANKWATPDSAALERLWQRIPDAPPEARAAALDAWAWTACGWLSRAEPIGQQMLDTLYTCLIQDARLGMHAAHALRVLTLHSRLVSPSRGFVVRRLYRQRTMETMLVAVTEALEGRCAAREPCLVAMATLLPGATDALVSMHLTTWLPLLVHTLGMDDAPVRLTCARTLQRIVSSEHAAALAEHLPLLVPRLLDAAATPQAPRLRVAALQALQALTDAVPAAHLDAYRRQVVQALGRPHRGVDDAVRAVRTAAVDCRAAWYATQE